VSTSRENLEVVVAWLDAMRRRDLTAVEELLEPDVVWRGLPAYAVCHNREDVLNMLRADELHEGLRATDALELVAGDGTVVLAIRSPEFEQIGDVPLAGRLFTVITVRNGRIASIHDYAARADALRAAGAEEPAWA
jgi:ketosteroid isomerase-like protein